MFSDIISLWQENLELNLQDKCNTADVVCCLQHLQVPNCLFLLMIVVVYLFIYLFPPFYFNPKKHENRMKLRWLFTCSWVLKTKIKEEDFYIMWHLCWNQGVTFLALHLTHLPYGIALWLSKTLLFFFLWTCCFWSS